VTRLLDSDGHGLAAPAVWRFSRADTASRLIGRPVRVGNNGAVVPPGSSLAQVRRTATASAVTGVVRSLRPLPWQRTCGPVSRAGLAHDAGVNPAAGET